MMALEQEKQKIVNDLRSLLGKSFVKENAGIANALRDLKRDIENDFFTIVVLGEFKRGKSTFINSLLGEALLPTDVLPETATINAIMYSEDKQLKVSMQDGSERDGEATREYLQRFSARSTEEDVNKIKYLKIGYPAEILKDRVVIVDTPGVSDINEQRCEVTYRFVPKANIVVFLLDANSPFKKTEKDFIEERLLSQGIDNILFLVNKYDCVDEEEEEDYLEDLQFRMVKAFSNGEHTLKAITLYPLSAKMAMEGILKGNEELIKYSGIKEVKAALQKMAREGRVEEEKVNRYKARLRNILMLLINSLENERALKSADVDKLREAKRGLDDMLAEQVTNKQNIYKYVETEKPSIYAMADKSLQYFYKKFEERVIDDIQFYKGLDFKDYVELRVSRTMQREMENWVATYSPSIDQLLKALEKEIARGISYRFNQKVVLKSNMGGNLNQHGYNFSLTAEDVSKSTIKAGAIAAGGAGLMMLMGGPLLMPFISMAAFPFLQRKFLEEKLAAAKEQIIPAIQEQLAEYIYNLKKAIHSYVDEKCLLITKNAESSYDMILEDLQCRVNKEIAEKEAAGSSLATDVQRITQNIDELMMIVQRL